MNEEIIKDYIIKLLELHEIKLRIGNIGSPKEVELDMIKEAIKYMKEV